MGAYVTYTYFPRTETVQGETKVQTEVQYQDRTVVQYVPKVVTVDAAGNETKENTDVEINKAQPAVDVKFNGKDYNFDLLQGETQKFQDGKLVVDQTSSLKVDVSAQVEQQITDGIKKAFDEQKNKPQYRIGGSVGVDENLKPDVELRVSRQSHSHDVDVAVDQHKDITGKVTFWLK